MPEETFVIRDGVRRAKAAWLVGHDEIWATVEGETTERKIPLSSIRSTKTAIDVNEKLGTRWQSIVEWMSIEPDLFEPIRLMRGDRGVLIADVELIASEEADGAAS